MMTMMMKQSMITLSVIT